MTMARTGTETVVRSLNELLCDEFVIYVKTRNYHWNVTGPQFRDLHKLFEEQYETLNLFIDEIAERVRALGGQALGSLQAFLKGSHVKEDSSQTLDSEGMITHLLRDHEIIVRRLRESVETAKQSHDYASENFLAGLIEKHDKMAWMLRSTLEGGR
ncbi:MAG: DNA starvation/stationary phase protection protein [Elusimicrobia bacterium]|nr:DNA starvation/stationary phase protection protein [Elusimicrobiota bacterium]